MNNSCSHAAYGGILSTEGGMGGEMGGGVDGIACT